MTRYAETTKVPVSQSRTEIERTIHRYGGTSFAYGYDQDRGVSLVGFAYEGRKVRFMVETPDERDLTDTQRAQRERQRWRALLLSIKAKLEVVESGITTFEEEFLAHLVLPGGDTVGDQVLDRLDEVGAGDGALLALPETTS